MSDHARIAEAPPIGMVALRADLADPAVTEALGVATGLSLPEPRRTVRAGQAAALWFSPDELLLMLPDAGMAVAALADGLAGRHHLVLDMTDARARFLVEGPGAREVLARGAPVDLAPERFAEGDLRRTRIGQLAAAIWCSGPERFEIVCFRSVAAHLRAWLETAAASPPAGLHGPR